MSSSVQIEKKNRDILILDKGSIQGLNNTTLTAEAKYPVNFTESGKRFVLGLHNHGSNTFFLLMPQK